MILSNRTRVGSLAACLVAGGLTAATGLAGTRTVTVRDVADVKRTGLVFAKVAKEASPAVVFLSVEKEVEAPSSFGDGFGPFGPGGRNFLDQFFGMRRRNPGRHRWGNPEPRKKPKSRIQAGQGSGFFVSPDGYILTNNHVVEDASTVKVKMSDGRKMTAKVIGTDPASDVALVKVEGTNFPYLEWGDSDALSVGEWVLAVGNPFGLDHSVTAGIISAKGRNRVGIVDYENFLQTDAAINPGNSGGPLIDLDGKVIGMNTAILSRSGASSGIGFAIPAQMVSSIYDQLKSEGAVTRGFLGIVIQDVSEGLAKSFGLKSTQGILVSQVMKDSPAARDGIQVGDVLLKLDGRKIQSMSAFRNKVALARPGTRLRLELLRDGKTVKRTVKVSKRDGKKDSSKSKEAQAIASEKLGLQVQTLSEDLATKFGHTGGEGVLVTAVKPGSPAARKGISEGALIVEVNRRRVETAAEFEKAVSRSKDSVLLLLAEGEFSRYLVLELEE